MPNREERAVKGFGEMNKLPIRIMYAGARPTWILSLMLTLPRIPNYLMSSQVLIVCVINPIKEPNCYWYHYALVDCRNLTLRR